MECEATKVNMTHQSRKYVAREQRRWYRSKSDSGIFGLGDHADRGPRVEHLLSYVLSMALGTRIARFFSLKRSHRGVLRVCRCVRRNWRRVDGRCALFVAVLRASTWRRSAILQWCGGQRVISSLREGQESWGTVSYLLCPSQSTAVA